MKKMEEYAYTALVVLSPEERQNVFSYFCKHCGEHLIQRQDGRGLVACYCWRNE